MTTNLPYATADQFLASMQAGFPSLSKQLKTIAQYVEKNRERLVLDGVHDVARHCGVQPSAIIRFAKHFGFSGFSQMQALFRDSAARQLAPNRDYQDRVRDLIRASEGPLSATGIAQEVIAGSIESLEALQRGVTDTLFDEAVELLVQAPSIWLAASRRAFPVGAYLAYALQHTGKPIQWLNGLGQMQQGQLRALKPDDVMIAVSFEPYAQETLLAVREAAERGARILAISDSPLSPLADHARVLLPVQDGATFGFRSLTSTLCLAQSLFMALAYRLEIAYTQPQAEAASRRKARSGGA
ncbi:RpiR family transcriptional regulator [Burkholderiaceae bacterium 16]|nr:RpiR family transcriptional regulator [Burkholderiaceae bacterium 16]